MKQISVNSIEGRGAIAAIMDDVIAEMKRAETIFTTWPENRIEASATVAEEAFEAMQVALNMRPHDPHCGGPKGTLEALRTEWVQTVAMGLRALMHLPEPPPVVAEEAEDLPF